jgi:LDH2 family malate/lactate/ureidoglycolate dehydrogenase
MRIIAPEEHRRFVQEVLEAAGAAADDAAGVADALLWADLRGRPEQGLLRLPILVRRLARHLIRSPAPMTWTTLAPAAHHLDAACGFGHIAGRLGMARAIELARNEGIGLVTVRRSVHYGAAGYYCALAADAGCVGFTCSNAFPRVAPFGGTRAVLGTNPLAFGCPTPSGAALLVDLATSTLAGSDVRTIHGERGRLPAGAALDSGGKPTDDPEAAASGCLLPAAGPKGFGLALMVEILSGVLSGAGVGREIGSLFKTWDRPIDAGHVFIAIAVERFLPRQAFLERVAGLLEWVKTAPAADGGEAVRYPGEIRARYAAAYGREGIPCTEAMDRVVTELTAEFRVRGLARG